MQTEDEIERVNEGMEWSSIPRYRVPNQTMFFGAGAGGIVFQYPSSGIRPQTH